MSAKKQKKTAEEEPGSAVEPDKALVELFDRLGARNNMSEEEAMELAIEAQKEFRRQRNASDGS